MTNYEITYIINPSLDEAENADAINEFDRLSKINDGILRHMIVKRED